MFMAVGRGSDNPPRMIVMRSGGEGGEGRPRPPPRDRRQGRLLRLRRHLHQAGRPDGRDEDGQDRGLHRHRGDRDGRPARPRHAAPGGRAGGREHARAALDPARRRRQGAERQEGRHHQHRRRGPADPRRRDDLRGAARGDPPRRCRDPHGRGLARARQPRDRGVRDAPGLVRRGDRGRRPGRRALLADPARRRLRPGHGELVRRPPELRLGRGLAGQERALPARVRDQAVGPSRHRRNRLLPQGDALRRARRERRHPRDARRARPRRGAADGRRRRSRRWRSSWRSSGSPGACSRTG